MAFVYEFKIRRALVLAGLTLSMLYCGDACNVSRPFKNVARMVKGVKIDPTSVNPYKIDVEPVIEEHDGRKWLSTDLVYRDMRFRLDYEAQTELTPDRLDKDPLVQKYIDERVDVLVREYAKKTDEPLFEKPGFVDKASDYVKEKIKEFQK